MSARHAWLVISPVAFSSEDEGAGGGIQTKLTSGGQITLIEQVDAFLNTWNSAISGGDRNQLINGIAGSFNVLDVPMFDFNGAESGLVLALMPCHASGTNIDVEPNEPRAE